MSLKKTKISLATIAAGIFGLVAFNKPITCALANQSLEQYGELYALTGGDILRGQPIDTPSPRWKSNDSVKDVFEYAKDVSLESLEMLEESQCTNTTGYTIADFQKSISDLTK